MVPATTRPVWKSPMTSPVRDPMIIGRSSMETPRNLPSQYPKKQTSPNNNAVVICSPSIFYFKYFVIGILRSSGVT